VPARKVYDIIIYMDNLYRKVKNYIVKHQMISEGDIVAAGVSGGADSVCMLYLLHELSAELHFRLLVVHVHHGIREDAWKDAEYVKELCEKLQVPFFLKKVDMKDYAAKHGLSTEEAGRILRYQAFEDVLAEAGIMIPGDEMEKKSFRDNAGKIAVAHNRNDRAETMLFHLFRGSGLTGLGSIRPVRGQIIRPLLCLDRAEIEAYLSNREVSFCLDSTNQEDLYTRNKIRHHILPYVEENICQNAAAHIGQAAEMLAETDDYLRRQTALALKRCLICQEEKVISLNLNFFRAEEPFLQKMILLQCMEYLTPHRKDIMKVHIDAMMHIIDQGGSREVILPYGLRAYKEYDRLLIGEGKKQGDFPGEKNMREQESLPIPVSIPGEVPVPGLGTLAFECMDMGAGGDFYKKGQNIPEKTYTKWFDYDKITTVLVLRTREKGDYLTIDKALRKKTIKEYMVNEKIPEIRRKSIYLLADGSHIVWIPGYRISQYYKVDENTKRILQVRLKEEKDG